MAKGIDKRKRIFDKYVSQLKTLHKNDLLPEHLDYKEGVYLCPICLNDFSEEDLKDDSANMLTLEDAPPKSLGGHANTLTCKTCNSRCGHEIDFHLTELLIELDVRAFNPNIESKAKLSHKGTQIQGTVKVDESGSIFIVLSEKNNNPEKLKKYIGTTGKDDIIDIEFKPSRVDKLRFEVALLKSAYILAFEQYGFALILNQSYDIVREQLQNPNTEIYPEGFWTKQSSFKKEHEGVHYLDSKDFEGFYSIFSLSTNVTEHRYGIYLPITSTRTNEICAKLKEQEGGFELNMMSYMGNDYFENLDNMKLMVDFMNKKNTP